MNLIRSVDQNLTLVLSWSALVARQVVSQDIQGDLRRNACTAFKPSRPSNIFKHYPNSQAPGYTIRDRGFKRISKALLCPPSEFWQNHPKSHFAFDNVSCGSILLVFGLLFLGGGWTVDPALSCLGRPVDTFILRPGDFFQVHKLLFGSLQHPKRRRASHSSRNLHEGVI